MRQSYQLQSIWVRQHRRYGDILSTLCNSARKRLNQAHKGKMLEESGGQKRGERDSFLPISPFLTPPPPLPPSHRLTAPQILTCSAIQRVGVKRSHYAPCGGILKETSIHGLFRNVSNAFYVLKPVDIISS